VTDGGFQNYLHMVYGLPNGFASFIPSILDKYYVTSQRSIIIGIESGIESSPITPMQADQIEGMGAKKDKASLVSNSGFLRATKRKNFKSGPYE
jgi:hypothetical protein